jgi:hypothetical protein
MGSCRVIGSVRISSGGALLLLSLHYRMVAIYINQIESWELLR